MIAQSIRFLLSNFTLTFFMIGIICSLVSIYRHRNGLTKALLVESFFSYYCLWALGICSLYNAVMHIVFHEMAAGFIGWADSPFQIEVGFASLGYGLVGIMAFRKNFSIRLALVVATSVFFWGAAAGHIHQISLNHNEAPGNAGVMLYTGLILPVISIMLLCLSFATSRAVYSKSDTQIPNHNLLNSAQS